MEVKKVLSRDGGKFRFYLNDELGEVLDFYSGEEERASEKQELGVVKLKPGPQQLRLEWIGEKGDGGAMRLDYLKLEKLDR